ncbi:MAG: nucleotidyltransferase family protein [Cyanobacteria bacterium J06623_7]
MAVKNKIYSRPHLIISTSSPELELILCCARTRLNSAELEQIELLLQQQLDWDYLITTAKLHKVIPLMYFNLARRHEVAARVPTSVLTRLRTEAMGIARHNLLFVRELSTLTQLFADAGLQVIPYKGLLLAASIYGDLSLRQFVDLDFLVAKEEYLAAQTLLLTRGYYRPAQNHVDWECSFAHRQRRIGVDLHQGLTPAYFPFHVDFPSLWQRLQPVSVGGVKVKSFAPEDLLIILCVQLAKDSQWTAEVLLKVCDIAELLRSYPDLDWSFVARQCKKLGTKRILWFALGVTQCLLQAQLPESVEQKIQGDKIVRRAVDRVCSEFFQRSEQSFRDRTYVERPYLIKLARERWQDKLHYFWQTAIRPNQEDWGFISLPKQLFFLYYLLRPVRLMLKYFGYERLQSEGSQTKASE